MPIAQNRCILSTKKVGTAQKCVRKSNQGIFPALTSISVMKLPSQNRRDRTTTKQRKRKRRTSRGNRTSIQEVKGAKVNSIQNCQGKILELRSGPGLSFGVGICLVKVRLFHSVVVTFINTLYLGKKYSTLVEK